MSDKTCSLRPSPLARLFQRVLYACCRLAMASIEDLAASLAIEELLSGLADGDVPNDVLLSLAANAVGERAEELSELQAFEVIEVALSKMQQWPHLCLVLLTNLTIVERHASVMAQDQAFARKVKEMMDRFLSYNPQAEAEDCGGEDGEWIESDPYGQAASVACNMACVEAGRTFLLKRSNGFMPLLLQQIRSKNVTRRRGSVAALRSCLFDSEEHIWFVKEVKILPTLLLPLVAPTPFTEQEKKGMDPLVWMQAEDPNRRPDPNLDVVKMLLECIVLLCQRRVIRQELRAKKVYPVVRNLDLFLEDEGVNDVVVQIVDFLIRDEEEGTEEERERGQNAAQINSKVEEVTLEDALNSVD